MSFSYTLYRKAGYSVRMTYEDFSLRYGVVGLRTKEDAEKYLGVNYPKEETVKVIVGEGADKEERDQIKPHWFLGSSKIFLSEQCSNFLENRTSIIFCALHLFRSFMNNFMTIIPFIMIFRLLSTLFMNFLIFEWSTLVLLILL